MSGPLGVLDVNPRDVLGYLATARPASPDLFFRRNLPRIGLTDSGGDTGHAALATGVATAVPIALAAGDVISNISVCSGQTAAGVPTNQWAALYSSAGTPALISQSVDRTTEAWAANTWRTFALAAAYTVVKAGVFWVSVMVAATTPPSLLGAIAGKALLTGERRLSQSHGSALTGTAPATIASGTEKTFAPLVVVS